MYHKWVNRCSSTRTTRFIKIVCKRRTVSRHWAGSIYAIYAGLQAQPRLPVGNYTLMPQHAVRRIYWMHLTRKKYKCIVATIRILQALHSVTRNETVLELTPEDISLVCLEKTEWEGAYIVMYRDECLSISLYEKEYDHIFHNTPLKYHSLSFLPIEDN